MHAQLQQQRPAVRRGVGHSRRRAVKVYAGRIDVDVVVVGSGIVGLSCAEALLKDRLSVAIVERKGPCAGATGAGQGYIWMAHRTPGTPAWDLAQWSSNMWKGRAQGDAPFRTTCQWMDTGSLLLASNAAEAADLAKRGEQLSSQRIQAQLLTAAEVRAMEPSVQLPGDGAGLLVESDAQIDGREAAYAVLARCKGDSRFRSLVGEVATSIGVEERRGGRAAVSVMTPDGLVRARLGIVVAAGVWTGDLVAQATGDDAWSKIVQPRKGHLLRLQPPAGMAPVRRGMMEMGYTKHYSAPGQAGKDGPDITFTATSSSEGELLLGSSREFSGFGDKASEPVVGAILKRASDFLPGLAGVSAKEAVASARVGLRPFASGGVPIIGQVPGIQGLYVATGHEGSGLTMGPGTAALIRHYVTGHPTELPPSRFVEMLPERRLQSLVPA